MEQFDMKKFEDEYTNLVLDCTETKENAVKAAEQVSRLRANRDANPASLAFWIAEEKLQRESWMKLRHRVASHKLVMKSLKAAAKEGKVQLTY